MVELGDEEVRNIDILRWRKEGYFSTEPIANFHPGRDELLPIPQAELDNNPLVAGTSKPGLLINLHTNFKNRRPNKPPVFSHIFM